MNSDGGHTGIEEPPSTNNRFKQWASIFHSNSTIASAVLDRLLLHSETVLLEETSFRMKDQIKE